MKLPSIMKLSSAVIKCFKIVALVLGTAFIGIFMTQYTKELSKDNPQPDPYDTGELGRYEFYLCTAVFGLLMEFSDLMFSARDLKKKYGAMAIVQILLAFQLMISTGLLAETLTAYQKEISSGKSHCEHWNELSNRRGEYTCTQLNIGVVCGFIAMAMFAVDSIFSMRFFFKPDA
ncbi:uncharacterized protein LOC114517320 isoform X2 [Dendronephthya gigantea]|uniref:uncharacterized protein LOC114517320 isoform X2 n=1 Tax=Dendronephthya gigantea TaxID=151771 RepID=UPI00106AA477|nr:uncharacterized protein LOC114517320 isoform X2 [Dendronephthya gigantea]